jgi:hypothetical protein
LTKQNAPKPTPSPPTPVDAPPTYDRSIVIAMQALARGEADSEQQKRAYFWILKRACLINDVGYRKGSFDESAFLLGRRFVGVEIVKLLEVPVSKMES